jgi:predicted amidohydrolase
MTRYDERLLSNTKISYMYTPGSAPVTFEVDGFHFGCSLGIEPHFPESRHAPFRPRAPHHTGGIQETVLLYQGATGRTRARRMLTDIDPTAQTLYNLSASTPTLPTLS